LVLKPRAFLFHPLITKNAAEITDYAENYEGCCLCLREELYEKDIELE
jgi:hypothetical protein